MNVLVFEWMVGGGLWHEGVRPQQGCHFLKQGQSMFDCLVEDLVIAGHHVIAPLDSRGMSRQSDLQLQPVPVSGKDQLKQVLLDAASVADAVVVVAPECDGHLMMLLHWLDGHRDKIISPSRDFAELASSKHATSEYLLANGVNSPQGVLVDDPNSTRKSSSPVGLPLIIKPDDGAGSENVTLVDDWDRFVVPNGASRWRVEPFVPGVAVSVSVIRGEEAWVLLTPTGQSFDGPFGSYVEAKYPLDRDVASRASVLASQAMEVLPATVGYFGIDMIIGEQDVVIEVNPRLTMSYCWLRKIESFNIANKMLELAGVVCSAD